MGYVIYLFNSRWERNSYGYWSGKNYTLQGQLFPITDVEVTERTKVYKSKNRANRALEACLERGYDYVTHGEVRAVN